MHAYLRSVLMIMALLLCSCAAAPAPVEIASQTTATLTGTSGTHQRPTATATPTTRPATPTAQAPTITPMVQPLDTAQAVLDQLAARGFILNEVTGDPSGEQGIRQNVKDVGIVQVVDGDQLLPFSVIVCRDLAQCARAYTISQGAVKMGLEAVFRTRSGLILCELGGYPVPEATERKIRDIVEHLP